MQKKHNIGVNEKSLSTHSESVASNNVSCCRAYDFYSRECNMHSDIFTLRAERRHARVVRISASRAGGARATGGGCASCTQ